MSDARQNETEPIEVYSIVGKILELVSERVACSPELLVAALKIAAVTVEETKSAEFAAQMRARMIFQYSAKR